MYNNDTTKTEKVRLLVEKHIALANKLAINKKKNLPFRISFDELQSAAYLGLTEAANRFDPERGLRFTTYAYPRICGAINDYLRELGKSTVSIESENEDLCFKDTIVSKKESNSELFDFIEDLLGKEAADMIQSYYVGRYSMKEIGKKSGISEGRVSQLISQYKQTLRSQTMIADLAA